MPFPRFFRATALRGHLLAGLAGLALTAGTAAASRPLSIDDVMGLSTVDAASFSPDGSYVATVLIRAPGKGDVFGRTYYEHDPSRADIWLTDRRTGARRNLTAGAADGAGFWCAQWSPDGRRLAMLSTRPEHGEPHGGDNVRLYVWDRQADRLARLSDIASASSTAGGSPLYVTALAGGQGGGAARQCSSGTTAPYLWLDATHLLVAAMPNGATSGLLDGYSHGLKTDRETLEAIHDGVRSTADAIGSGTERIANQDAGSASLSLVVLDVAGTVMRRIDAIPNFPFRAGLQLLVSPDGRTAAILATTGAIQPVQGQHFAYPYDAWSSERRLGLVDLKIPGAIRWIDNLPADGRYLLDLLAWSPDSHHIALRARGAVDSNQLNVFALGIDGGSPRRLNPTTISANNGGSLGGAGLPSDMAAFWADNTHLLVRAVTGGSDLNPEGWYRVLLGRIPSPRRDWWLLGGGAARNLTATLPEAPEAIWKGNGPGAFWGIGQRHLWSIDARAGRMHVVPSADLPPNAVPVWPQSPDVGDGRVVLRGRVASETYSYALVDPRRPGIKVTPFSLTEPQAELLDVDPDRGRILGLEPATTGTTVTETDPAAGATTAILQTNQQLAQVDWGRIKLIDYQADDGQPVKAAVILPPDYVEGRKYPTLVWVYAGSIVRNLNNPFLDPYAPGFYNLQLYAARGYVVLIPSMPLPNTRRDDNYVELPKGVMPAVNKLVDLGIADNDRLAVMGQSYGGYSVYSLLTYTNRFKAGIAIAGLTDLVSMYGEIDATARGYPGIDHEKSDNWGLAEVGQERLGGPPYENLWQYWRNSPINYVDRVQTPLLMIHGEQDIRGPLGQAEEFFFSLYRQGKTARLVRYWGEDHGLRESPANTRDIHAEVLRWLDRYLKEKPSATAK